MGFFGKIGIDWQLMLAQAVNFAILFWLLKRLFYKPLLKGMEEDELMKAEKKMDEVKRLEEQMRKSKAEAIDEIKKKSSEIISEAERVAKSVREKARQEADDLKSKLVEQTKTQLKEQEQAAASEVGRKRLKTAAEQLRDVWASRLVDDAELRQELQQAYWDDFVKEAGLLPGEGLAKTSSADLTCASPLTPTQKKKVTELLAAKSGKGDFRVNIKADDGLMAGFRIEAAGLAVESSLAADIQHAFTEKDGKTD